MQRKDTSYVYEILENHLVLIIKFVLLIASQVKLYCCLISLHDILKVGFISLKWYGYEKRLLQQYNQMFLFI